MPPDDPASARRFQGVLTPKDVEYLSGDAELDENASRNARYRIRERIKHAVQDFHVLTEELPASDREQIFADLLDTDPEALVSAIAFVYHGTEDLTEDSSASENHLFDLLVAEAMQEVEDHPAGATDRNPSRQFGFQTSSADEPTVPSVEASKFMGSSLSDLNYPQSALLHQPVNPLAGAGTNRAHRGFPFDDDSEGPPCEGRPHPLSWGRIRSGAFGS